MTNDITHDEQIWWEEEIGGLVDEMAKDVPTLYSLAIMQGGQLRLERYWRHQKRTDYQDIRSATKSVTALLCGTAWSDGLLPQLDTPVYTLFPEYRQAQRASFRQVTLHDLLTMTADTDWRADAWLVEEPVNHWHESADWLNFLFERPTMPAWSRTFRYCSGDSYMLGVLVERCVGQPFHEYAQQRLFKPLGIRKSIWPLCPAGYAMAHAGLKLSAPDLLKLGQLVLQQGRWQQTELIDPSWITKMIAPHCAGTIEQGAYGYQWWVRQTPEVGHIALAIGAGGQYIAVIRELDMVIVATAKPRGRHWVSIWPMIEQLLLPKCDEKCRK